MKRSLKPLAFALAIVTAVLTGTDTRVRATAGHAGTGRNAARLDTRLRAVLDEIGPELQRVIIRVRPAAGLRCVQP